MLIELKIFVAIKIVGHKQGVITMADLVIKEDNLTERAKEVLNRLRNDANIYITDIINEFLESLQ